VIDYEAPSSQRALLALEPHDARTRLFKLAVLLAGSDEAGTDLLADAVACVCDPHDGRPWDADGASFCAHMREVLRDLARDERRTARARREVRDAAFAIDEVADDPGGARDEAATSARTAERLQRMGGRLRATLGDDERAARAFELICGGVDGAARLAQAMSCSLEEAHAASRRIARGAARVLDEERRAEQARMRELRERARARKEPP